MPIAIIASRPSVASVERGADRHAVDVGAEDLVGLARADAGPVEQVGQRYAEPAGAADVRAADVVGDAGQRDVALDQVGIASRSSKVKRDLLVDVAVDGQRPVVDVDDGQREAGVDAVELVVGRPERRDAGDLARPGPSGAPAPGRRRRAASTSAGRVRYAVIQRPAPPMAAAAAARAPAASSTPRRLAVPVPGRSSAVSPRSGAGGRPGGSGRATRAPPRPRRRRPGSAPGRRGRRSAGCRAAPPATATRASSSAAPTRTAAAPAGPRPRPARARRGAPTRSGSACRWCRTARSPTP